MSSLTRAFFASRESVSTGTRIMWSTIAISATVMGIILLVKGALMVFAVTSGDVSIAEILRKNQNSGVPGLFAVHIVTGTIALLIGPWQLLPFLRRMLPRLHRWLGRAYVGLVLIASSTSHALVPRLDTFGTQHLRTLMAIVWPIVTILGVVAARKLDLVAHRRWMMRSYAFTYMGLTFILFTWIGDKLGLPLAYKYPAKLWLTLLTNVLVVETLLWRSSIRTIAEDAPATMGRPSLVASNLLGHQHSSDRVSN